MTDQLTPGPELDKWLAVELMGWKWFQDHVTSSNRLIPPSRQVAIVSQYLAKHPSWRDEETKCKAWSTSSAQAVEEIIPAMRKRGWECRCDCGELNTVWFYSAEYKRSSPTAFHSTFAGAVGMAAKKALEEKP